MQQCARSLHAAATPGVSIYAPLKHQHPIFKLHMKLREQMGLSDVVLHVSPL